MRRRTWLWWALGALLVLAVLGGVAYAFFGGSGGVAVPQVSGLPVQQATEQVTQGRAGAQGGRRSPMPPCRRGS